MWVTLHDGIQNGSKKPVFGCFLGYRMWHRDDKNLYISDAKFDDFSDQATFRTEIRDSREGRACSMCRCNVLRKPMKHVAPADEARCSLSGKILCKDFQPYITILVRVISLSWSGDECTRLLDTFPHVRQKEFIIFALAYTEKGWPLVFLNRVSA